MTETEKTRQAIINGCCKTCPTTKTCNETCRIWREIEMLKERGE